MPSPCPQCGTLRARRASVCKNCGYDPAAAEVAGQPTGGPAIASAAAPETPQPPETAAPPWSPPVVCPRCGAPVNAGNAFCANCALPLATNWSPPPPNPKRKLAIIGAIGAVVVIAVVGLLLIGRSRGWDPGNEPSPSGTWQAYTSPDGTWSAMFPGRMTPVTVTQNTSFGYGTIAMKIYVTTDGEAAYEVAVVDIPTSMLDEDLDAFYDTFERSFLTAPGGTVTASRSLTVGEYRAREIKFVGTTAQKLDGYARFWLVGERMYLMLAMAQPGATMYPQHFFDSFTLK